MYESEINKKVDLWIKDVYGLSSMLILMMLELKFQVSYNIIFNKKVTVINENIVVKDTITEA